ncbi:fructosamine kinase [Mariprofundus micogutta]|uniref:Fructosamine kinase n=1 Tax=Mariprofundus micogutta TaxID=1921010 RepID=A0A1L8CN44_9PROT|nr:fructosamine kinase family protein [Mariprofundus micogutta]GAV20336.1 fructosamine kinase [Mariprofundus micogutta]
MLWQAVEHSISQALDCSFNITHTNSLSGGSINSAYRIDDGDSSYFVKLNGEQGLSMFEAEAEGLRELAAAKAIRVPEPVCYGAESGRAWLVTEYISFGRQGSHSAQLLGEQLAALHRNTSEQFGWYRDNTIGSTVQQNSQSDHWVTFYRQQRLQFQLDLASRHGLSGSLQDKGDRLLADLDVFFSDYAPQASLLHGDLWGGNCSFDTDGNPVIFDPAVYYGDREADLAMTELFGGFNAGFYAAYNEVWPLHVGYQVRKELYNLYHTLNHANLFGGGYAAQAESMMDRLLSEMKP